MSIKNCLCFISIYEGFQSYPQFGGVMSLPPNPPHLFSSSLKILDLNKPVADFSLRLKNRTLKCATPREGSRSSRL